MDTQNWSTSYFSKDGFIPSYPPNRIRLSSGETRYTSHCLLKELHDAGFEGPIEVPFIGKNEKLLWDSASYSFTVVKSENKDLDLTNREVRSFCDEQLKVLNFTDESYYDEAFRNAWSRYVTTLLDLLKKPLSELLTFEDLPDIPTLVENQETYRSEVAYNFIDQNLTRWKGQFETYGFCFEVPPEVQPYFSIPSGWIAGTQPLSPETSNYFEHAIPPQPLP